MTAVQGRSELPFRSNKVDQTDVLSSLDDGEYERIRETGRPRLRRSHTSLDRERLMQLAQPKEPKVEWYTSVGPHLKWGTQEMIWPIKKSTLSADASERLQLLAIPKRNFFKKKIESQFYYSCGRSSVIWDVEEKAKNFDASERLRMLSKAKEAPKEYEPPIPQYKYSCGRKSPIWEVGQAAKAARSTSRLEVLAQRKSTDRLCLPDKPVQTSIPPPALTTEPTHRISMLATPKPRPDGPFRDPKWEVSENAKNSSATTRCTELARPKGVPEGYLVPREVEWSVTKAAKRAVSTGRIEELSKPIIRATMDHVQFNPDAFKVKELALKGVFPSRIDKLARPLER